MTIKNKQTKSIVMGIKERINVQIEGRVMKRQNKFKLSEFLELG